jgi:hypothetical protein
VEYIVGSFRNFSNQPAMRVAFSFIYSITFHEKAVQRDLPKFIQSHALPLVDDFFDGNNMQHKTSEVFETSEV